MTMDEIAEFVLGTPQIPEATLDFAATLFVDTIGVAAGASMLDAGRIARDHVVRFQAAGHDSDSARLLFDGRSASLVGAAFAAAAQIDNLDGHDGYNPTKGHIGCAVVPALCAMAEQVPDLSARDAMVAMVIGYETATRAAITLHATVSDYHTSGAWNALGVAAMCARLMGLDATQLRHALGIAEYHGPRSQMMREIANPTMLHDGSGMGAMVGVMAALMAADGFEGAPAITADSAEAAPFWADLGTLWTTELNYIKPYPICRWAHAAIDGLDAVMRDHDLTEADIARIDVATFAQAAALYSGVPTSSSQAQYSLPFALAVRLIHGAIGPAHISGDGLCDRKVIAALDRIRVTEAARHSERFPLGRWSDVTVTLTDGRTLASGDIHATGGPEAPRPLSDVEAKFHVMAAPLAKEHRNTIWAMRDQLLSDTLFATLIDPVYRSVQ